MSTQPPPPPPPESDRPAGSPNPGEASEPPAAGDSSTTTAVAERFGEELRRRGDAVRFLFLRDLVILDRLPGRRWSTIGAIAAVTLLFSLAQVGIDRIHTESPVALLAFLLVGLVSQLAGIVTISLHVVFDLVRWLDEPLRARAIGWWLVLLLVVVIPGLQRRLAVWMLDDPRTARAGWPGVTVASAVLVGALTHLWLMAAPYVVRGVFTPNNPPLAAVEPMQEQTWLITVAAAVVTALVVGLVQRTAGVAPDVPVLGGGRLAVGWGGMLRRAVVLALILVVFRGIVSGWLDVVILVVAIAGSEFVAVALGRQRKVVSVITRVPLPLRVGGAILVTWVFAYGFMQVLYQPVAGSEFFPIIASIAFGIFIIRIAGISPPAPVPDLDPDVVVAYRAKQAAMARSESESPPPPPAPEASDADEPGRGSGGAGPVLTIIGATIGLLVLAAEPALAHDCSGLFDCVRTAGSRTAGAAAAAAAAAAGWASGMFGGGSNSSGSSSGSGGSGSSGASGSGGSGSGGSGSGGSGDPSAPGPGDVATDVASAAWGEAGSDIVDQVYNVDNKNWTRFFDIRVRPKIPGNPLIDLLSDEGAAAAEGAGKTFKEMERRQDYDLASADADFEGYYEDRAADARRGDPGSSEDSSEDASGSGDDEMSAETRERLERMRRNAEISQQIRDSGSSPEDLLDELPSPWEDDDD